jgi:hypothetical protein
VVEVVVDATPEMVAIVVFHATRDVVVVVGFDVGWLSSSSSSSRRGGGRRDVGGRCCRSRRRGVGVGSTW